MNLHRNPGKNISIKGKGTQPFYKNICCTLCGEPIYKSELFYYIQNRGRTHFVHKNCFDKIKKIGAKNENAIRGK